MLSARDILKRVIRNSEGATRATTESGPEHFTRFSGTDDTPPPAPPAKTQLSRFAHQHQRVKPKPEPAQLITREQAAAIAAQISNDGADSIPVSVLQRALPDRVDPGGSLDGLAQIMPAKPLVSRRHA